MWDDKSKGDFGIIGPIDASGSRSLVPLIEDFIPMSGWNFRWRIAAAHNNSSGRVKSKIDAILRVERMVQRD